MQKITMRTAGLPLPGRKRTPDIDHATQLLDLTSRGYNIGIAATSTDRTDDEPDELEMIDQRNHERRTVHAAAKLAAEIDFVAKAKPAELIAIVLSRRLDAMEASYGMPERTRAVCERLGLDVADIDPSTVDHEIRKENHAANVKAVRDYAAKNGSNLARAAMTVEIVIYPHVTFDAIAYPDEPEYEEYPDDEYEDGF